MPEISATTIARISPTQAWHYQIIPTENAGTNGAFFTIESHDQGLQAELELLIGEPIQLIPLAQERIQKLLAKYYRRAEQGTEKIERQTDSFLEKVLNESKALGSSDIHLEPFEEHARVRFRIDGALIERHRIPQTDYPSLVNQIKIKAQLDIAEKRLPQDGRILLRDQQEDIDLRVSTLPTLHGEKVVLRLLRSGSQQVDFNKLGFQSDELERYQLGVKKPNGIILISGPTGSGKTTTLYATLQQVNKPDRNILTIEDPIEYTLEGINQVQLKESIGLSYPNALRTFLRQDPDIIMVGEIRDVDTASMAIRASLTGHLVLSTIHTNSAWGTVGRLLDMGIPAFLLADTLNMTVSQRLLRLLCPHCKTSAPYDPDFYGGLKLEQYPKEIYQANGCPKCHYVGYQGRKAVYEVIRINDQLASHIRQSDLNIQEVLKQENIRSLAENAINLWLSGETDFKEIKSLLIGTDHTQ